MDNVNPQLRNRLTFVETPVRAVSYCRVSTEDQGEFGSSLDSQEKRIAEFARNQGFEIVATLKESASGFTLDREQFAEARRLLRNGTANALIVYEPSRLSRHRTHGMLLLDEFLELGVRLFVAKGEKELDPKDHSTVLIFAIENIQAHKERDDIIERTTRGRMEWAEKNRIVVAIPPFGYGIERITETTPYGREILVDRKLVIDPDEAAIVRLIFNLYANHDHSANSLQNYLNDNGYRFRGKPFARATLRDILKREAYIGKYSYNGVDQEVPAIISEDLWYTILNKRRQNKQSRRQMKHYTYPFSTRITCKHCGHSMVGVTCNVSRGTPTPYYKCNVCRPNMGYNKSCDNNKYYPAKKIESIVMDWLEKLLTDPVEVKRGLIAYHESLLQQYQPLLEDHKRTKALLQKYEAKLERLFNLYVDGSKDKEFYLSHEISLEDSIQAAKATIAEQEQRLSEINTIPDQIQTVEQLTSIAKTGFELGIPAAETKQLVEALDVRLELYYQDGSKWVEGNCILTLENPGKKLERIVGEPS